MLVCVAVLILLAALLDWARPTAPGACAGVAGDCLTIDVARVLTDTATHPVGINVDYLMDDDHNRQAPRSTQAALAEMGVRYLRYPGGEKSDSYLWSIPPFDRSAPSLSRIGPAEWPSGDPHLMEPNHRTFKIAPLSFDAFMAVAKRIGAQPILVVDFDSMYKPATAGGVAPTKQQLLHTATAWVRYANITKKYGVKYWEIGNESYRYSYNGGTTAAVYARDFVDFARAMKQVDPSIKIGANGSGRAWWRTILHTASQDIDFLVVHNYPVWPTTSYDVYRADRLPLTREVDTAVDAINRYAPPVDRARLTVAVTEVNARDPSPAGWVPRNNLGNAIVLFDIIGQLLQNPMVSFSLVWNTRWVHNNVDTTPELADALSPRNQLYATGRALAIWGQYMLDHMVYSSNTDMIRSYASYAPATRQLNIFLINRDYSAHTVTLDVQNYGVSARATTSVFTAAPQPLTGAGEEGNRGGADTGPPRDAIRARNRPDDQHPLWAQVGHAAALGGRPTVTLNPVSITVLSITPTVAPERGSRITRTAAG